MGNSAEMLVASPVQPQPLMYERRFLPVDDDDDDALQAVLLASLCESATSASAEEVATSAATQAQEALFDSCTVPDRVSKPVSLSDYAVESGLDVEAHRALRALEEGPLHLKLCRIRGDGHCLFRAISASLVLVAAWGGNAALMALRSHLLSLNEACAAGVVEALFHLLGRTAADASGAADALNDEQRSDAAVGALRRCAVGHMQQHAERFRLCCDGEDLKSYCARMALMTGEGDTFSPAYGGHSEVVALSEALQVRVEIVDCSGTAAKSTVPTYRLGEHLPMHAPVIFLLRRGLHYHLMLPAQTEGERMAGNDAE